jgi:hypothetical protein
MLSPTELGRRITSAQDNLRAARRDGRYDDIVTWRKEVDELLDQVQRTSPSH